MYSTSNPLHLSALLKAVRTTYNIFLLSRNNDNQNVAQVTMTQMVDHIFRRVKSNPNHIVPVQETVTIEEKKPESIHETEEEHVTVGEDTINNTASNAPIESEEDATTYQQQIIVEANMARTEMDHKLPTGRSKDNYEDFLNDTANVFQEEQQNRVSSTSHTATTAVYETT